MLRHIKLAMVNCGVVVLIILAPLIASCRSPEEPQQPTITGVVKNASGEPVAGAFVKVGSADLGLSFMVISQAQGRYSTPTLLPGKYTIQGFGGGYQSDAGGLVEVGRGPQGKMDLVLSTPQKVTPQEKRMISADYEKLMPEGEGQKIITTRCVLCHGLERIVPTRHTRQVWEKSVDRMRFFFNDRTDLQEQFNLRPIADRERDEIVDYVAKHFGMDTPPLSSRRGPPDPNKHLPRTLLLKEAEAKYVAMEFAPPSDARRYEIGVDSQGNAWITEEGTGIFGPFDPESLTYTRIATPPGKFPRSLAQIAVDPQDQVWILDNGPTPDAELLQYNPKSGEFKTYEIPAPPRLRAPLNTLRFLDGNVWGTGNASTRILKLDPITREITTYPAPKGSHPYGIAIGGDHAVWYTGNYDNAVVRLDPDTGKLTQYKTPRGFGLRRMGADAEGNIWVAAQDADKLVKVDIGTGQMTEYDVPTKNSGPYSVDVDTTRNLIWFTERDADKIGRFDPRTNTFVEFSLPSADTAPRRILVDPTNPNRVWWGSSDRVGYVEVIE